MMRRHFFGMPADQVMKMCSTQDLGLQATGENKENSRSLCIIILKTVHLHVIIIPVIIVIFLLIVIFHYTHFYWYVVLVIHQFFTQLFKD